jgi:hypothetical protein
MAAHLLKQQVYGEFGEFPRSVAYDASSAARRCGPPPPSQGLAGSCSPGP